MSICLHSYHQHFHTCSIALKIYRGEADVCADTGASHSTAGEKSYHLLQNKKVKFKPKNISLTLTDGTQNNVAVFTTVVNFTFETLRASELPVSRDNGTMAPLWRRSRPRKFNADSLLRHRTSQRGNLLPP
ncbi:uncharacterized protein NPIL_116801 [Nephila pilipes]|uniref:Uncharacterized protein n=1 Tax=Nephila pilipes TaxID=299642 RepID=A0A8X6IW14_NEPPI|nr:uncharacterized protein NPIL_116801 [Nephila pilipes]